MQWATNATVIASGTKQRPEEARYVGKGAPSIYWSGMYFRSKAELKIAQVLRERGMLFFANSQGTASLKGLPITMNAHGMVEQLESVLSQEFSESRVSLPISPELRSNAEDLVDEQELL